MPPSIMKKSKIDYYFSEEVIETVRLNSFRSALGSNMYTYLKFGLPRVFPPNGSNRSGTPVGHGQSRMQGSNRHLPR